MKVEIFPIYKELEKIQRINKKDFVKILRTTIKPTKEDGYAGEQKFSELVKYTWKGVFGENKNLKEFKRIINTLKSSKIESRIRKILRKTEGILDSRKVRVFVFPMMMSKYNEEVIKDLHGVNAITSWKRNFLVFVYPFMRNWRKALDLTVVHEYCHSVRLLYSDIVRDKNATLLDYLIHEGLADNLTKTIIDVPEWAVKLTKKQEKIVWEKIRNNLHSTAISYKKFYDYLNAVLFGKKERFPKWAGYAIGFNIVKSFLRNNPKVNWNKLIKMNSDKILKSSNY